MDTTSEQTLRIPELGEGMREAIVLTLHREPGQPVSRDAPLYSIETDKAVIDIESPVDGVLSAWLVASGDTVAVGAPVACLTVEPAAMDPSPETTAGVTEEMSPTAQPVAADAGRPLVAPRVRAHARALGFGDAQIADIPAAGARLSIEDVERYASVNPGANADAHGFRDHPLSAEQQRLNARMVRSTAQLVPATIRHAYDPGALRRAAEGSAWSELEVLAYRAVCTAADHPKLRSVSVGDAVRREYEHVHLGIAVARANGELASARLDDAERLRPAAFVHGLRAAIRGALRDGDQASGHMQMVVSHMPALDIVDATPVLVAPAVAVLFLGAPLPGVERDTGLLSLSFDHRVVDGLSAARFLHDLALRLADPLPVSPAIEVASGEASIGPPRSPTGATVGLDQLTQRSRELLAELLRLDPAQVPPDVPVRELGLSSLDSVELTERLGRELGLSLAPTLVWDHPTAAAIAGHLQQSLRRTAPDSIPADNANMPAAGHDLLNQVAGLSDEQALALLHRLEGEDGDGL